METTFNYMKTNNKFFNFKHTYIAITFYSGTLLPFLFHQASFLLFSPELNCADFYSTYFSFMLSNFPLSKALHACKQLSGFYSLCLLLYRRPPVCCVASPVLIHPSEHDEYLTRFAAELANPPSARNELWREISSFRSAWLTEQLPSNSGR